MLQRYKKNRTSASFHLLNVRLFLLDATKGLFQYPQFCRWFFRELYMSRHYNSKQQELFNSTT